LKRALLLPLFLLFAACVPASEELPPAGGAGFDAVPSAATQGEPFETGDGWSVRIEKLAFQVSVAASPLNRGYGSSEPWVFDARKPARLYARALPVGPVRVSLALYGRYIANRGDYDDYDYYDRVERVNVDDETNARFNRLPDEGQESAYTPGPSVLLAARAERGGRTVTLDMALNVTTSGPRSFSEDFGIPVEVRGDELASVELPIDATLFFPIFDDIANSDADGDGRITAPELEASKVLPALEQRIGATLVR
jgi:hypothetical protein